MPLTVPPSGMLFLPKSPRARAPQTNQPPWYGSRSKPPASTPWRMHGEPEACHADSDSLAPLGSFKTCLRGRQHHILATSYPALASSIFTALLGSCQDSPRQTWLRGSGMYTTKLEARLAASIAWTLVNSHGRGVRLSGPGRAGTLAYGTASAARQRHWPGPNGSARTSTIPIR